MLLQHKLICATAGYKQLRRSRDRWQKFAERLNSEHNTLRVRYGLKHRTLVPRLVELGKPAFK